VVFAPATVAVVRHAGGLLFDRVISGWDVSVLIAGEVDMRPLRILGVNPTDLERALASPSYGPRPQAIAVEAGMYGSDPRVRRLVRQALDGETTEVRIWGDAGLVDLEGGGDPVQYRLSMAARAFKAQALAAAAVAVDSISVTETFREPPRHARASGLVPVG
jgi:hypothetical protein